jgi:hypothetical protein
MNREEFKNFLETKSKYTLVRDSYGNYKGTKSDGTIIRYKIQNNSVRFESMLSYKSFEGQNKNVWRKWRKVWSEYYKNLEINPETGKLRRIKR